MSDDKGKDAKETIAEEAQGIGREAYKDVGRPILAPVGKTLGTAVEVLLAPVDIILGGLKGGLDRLKARLGRKLESVPEDRRLAAPATIAAPAALQYALLGEGDEVEDLREMFENLLMASMDSEKVANAHPAFVSVISQMTQEDAWIAKSITQQDYAACDVFQQTSEGQRPHGMYTLLGIDAVKDSKVRARSISNLDRLGIITVSGSTPSNPHEYEDLKKVVEADFPEGTNTFSLGKAVVVTPFGQQFLDTCVRVRRS